MSDPEFLPPALTWIQSNFSALLDAAPDAILVVDDQGRIVLANRQTEQLFGYSDSELLGRKVEQRGGEDGHDAEDWLRAEEEISRNKGTRKAA